MSEESVFAPPSFPVARVERVDVDVAPVAVERRADARCGEAVHGLAVVREPSEEMVVAAAVDPVRPDVQCCDRTRPVGEMKLPRAQPAAGAAVEVRKRPAPGLKRPVRAVRRGASCYLERERRAVVCAALIPEGGPVAARVVLPKAGPAAGSSSGGARRPRPTRGRASRARRPCTSPSPGRSRRRRA